MDDSQRAIPVPIKSLLQQIAEGIGEGHRTLVAKAKTEHNTLAIKTADVQVEFALSTRAVSAGLTGPSIGAHTLIGITSSEFSATSTAVVNLHIVPIAPAEPPPNDTKDAPAGPSEERIVAALRVAVQQLKERAARHADPGERKRMLADLNQIEQAVDQGDVANATRLFETFSQNYEHLASG